MHRKYILSAALAFFFMLLFQGQALMGSDLEISTEFGTERREGFTQYQIRFLALDEDDLQIFGNSRLKFPFTSYFSGGSLNAEYAGFSASFGYWQEYRSSKDEVMEDFDWLTSSQNDDIRLAYGTTTPDPEIYYFQIGLGYDFKYRMLEFGPFFEYTKFHSEFTMTDLDQLWFYDLNNGTEYDPPRDTMLEGEVLYYEQDLHLPIFGADVEMAVIPGKVGLKTRFGVSPFASVDDYDNHIVRSDSLEAWNSGDGGTAWLFELGGRFEVFDGLWLKGRFGYSDYSINTTGTQRVISDETGEPVVASGIDSQVRGVMRNFRVSISYLFGS
ncbi:MAG: hypothetical protein GF310_07745 [candidate division Zixibacteria bacterium]|nr:hypothetical protein [candidate division Zixibacteria bacterium]